MKRKKRLLALLLAGILAGSSAVTALAAETDMLIVEDTIAEQDIQTAEAQPQSDMILPEEPTEELVLIDDTAEDAVDMMTAEEQEFEDILPESAAHTLGATLTEEELPYDGEGISMMANSVYNTITPNSKDKNKTIESGKLIQLKFTLRHYIEAEESRAVIAVYNPEGKLATKKAGIATYRNGTGKTTVTYELKTEGSGSKPDAAIGEYKVKCYTQVKRNGKWVRPSACKVTSYSFFLTPRLRSVTGLSSSIRLKWSAANYEVKDKSYPADLYRIYRKTGSGDWEKIAYIKGYTTETVDGKKVVKRVTEWEDKDVKNGKLYTYRIRSVRNDEASKYSSEVKCFYLKKMSAPTLKASGKTKIIVSWKPVSAASGYEIRFSRKSDMSGAKTVTLEYGSTDSVTLTNMTENTQYYIQIRCFAQKSGKTYYSAWSKAAKRIQ